MASNADEVTRLNPVARVILQGLYDVESPWHMLLGMHHILKTIWLDVISFWKSKIIGPTSDNYVLSFLKVRQPIFFDYRSSEGECIAEFPKPKNININMMPFVMERKFKKTKLPKYLKRYYKQVIQQCIRESEVGKVGYLTIQESHVDKGSSQRRPGIHTESPGVVLIKDKNGERLHFVTQFAWGLGCEIGQEIRGGIYMASNVENSCRVWNCQIKRPEDGCPEVVGDLGDIEHLREFLPPYSEVMAGNRIYWLTDRTPHESLPLDKATNRQFFRLVTSQVSVWYEDHSTKNPMGVVPDSKITRILKGSKFDGNCYEVDVPTSV